MMVKTHARRYAQAVFDIARERNELDQWQADLIRIADLANDAQLAVWLENPKLRFEAKAKLLSERLGGISPLALNLVHLLVKQGRLSMAGGIANEYERLVDKYRGIERAEVVAAIPLDEDEKQELARSLEAIVKKKIVVKTKVDSRIVGGVLAHIDGKLLDGSTHGRLMALKRKLAKAGG
jgi:F-type H+-transporting ATPase subunit delta